jgi:hypothetical protein
VRVLAVRDETLSGVTLSVRALAPSDVSGGGEVALLGSSGLPGPDATDRGTGTATIGWGGRVGVSSQSERRFGGQGEGKRGGRTNEQTTPDWAAQSVMVTQLP